MTATAPAPAAPAEAAPQLLRICEVKARTTLSASQIYKLMAAGDFPRCRKLGRSSAWLEGDINKWILSRSSSTT
jgi:prophage regulatory protein